MKINSFTLGQLQTNSYLLISKENNCIIIDPADDANFISERILINKLTPKLIIATHGHFDHILAAGELQKAFNIPFAINYKDLFLIKDVVKRANYWLKNEVIFFPPTPSIDLSKEKQITLDELMIEVIPTPGHTPGSISLYIKNENTLFTGDTYFKNANSRTDFAYSNKSHHKKSIEKIKELLGENIYSGH